MHQAASGDGNIQVLIKDSPNCVVTIGGRKVVDLWLPHFRIPLDPTVHKEIDLLLARHAITTLTGRDELWQTCLTWGDTAAPVSIRCITGRGGSGKTRFALEFAHDLRDQPNSDARFVKWMLPEPIDLWSQTHGSNNVLLIVDYAADHVTPLRASLQQLANNLPQSPNRRLRILLLARTADWDQGWLTTLKPGSTNDEPIANYFDPPKPIELPALGQSNRIALFAQALKKAAEFTGLDAPALPAFGLFESHRAKETLRDPLTLMMAAIVGLQSGIPEALSLTRLGLAHEVADRLVADRLSAAFGDQAQLAHHMAAYLTLCGGLSLEAAQDTTVKEATLNNLGTLAAPGAFIEQLRNWLPSADGGFGPIEPDIVGEAFLTGKTRPRLSHADTTLHRAVAQAPESAIAFLMRAAQDFCLPQDPAEACADPLNWIETLINRGEIDDPSLLLRIEEGLPSESVVLRQLSLRVTTLILERVRNKLHPTLGSQSELARAFTNHANRLAMNGKPEQALAAADESVSLYGRLADRDGRTYLPLLAISLNNLAARLDGAGRTLDAIEPAESSVTLHRDLVLGNYEYSPGLAMSLNNLAQYYHKCHRRDEALTTGEAAVGFCIDLVAKNRERFLPELAGALCNLALIQGNSGRGDAALRNAKDSVQLRYELVGRNRDAFLPGLAMSLNNLASFQLNKNLEEDALVTVAEAALLRRELLSKNRDAFAVDLATSLGMMGLVLDRLERFPEAAAAFSEGLSIVLPYAAQNPEVNRAGIAGGSSV